MTRTLLALGSAILLSAPAFAVIAPPVPRLTEWKVPDAPAVEEPKPGEMEEPGKILERVTQNAKAVGDRLKDQDTGDETRKKQDQVLKDIDALLKQNDPPPSGGGGGSSEMPPPPDGMPPPNGGMPPPMGGNSGMKPMGMGSGQPMPMGGSGQQRPKRGGGTKEPMPMGTGMKDPMMQPVGMKDPMPMGGMKDPMMQPGGMGKPGPDSGEAGKPKGGTPPTLPNEDPFTKQVWGHLPEKLRQQASQYYREQYMPKYQEMLKQYYSNLAERDRGGKK